MEIRTNVKTRLFILVFFALISAATSVARKVIYINGGASGANKGSSWTQL